MDEAVALRTAGQPRLSGRAQGILKDERLAALVAGGNDDAFATLYQRHHQALYRYCLSLLGQEADARDALQSSMLAALSSLRARPIDGAFKPWLFRIGHNESISIIRGRSRVAPTDAPPPVATSDDPETREELRTVVSDLGALPDRQRGAIVMRELNGLSYAAIAAALGTSEAGGKQLVYQARSAMHELREGHDMSCTLVRERISAHDMRLLRGRKVRSHLRGCQSCQDFEEAIRRRRTALVMLAPPLAPLAAAAVLQDVFGGFGTAGAGGGGMAAATATAGVTHGGVQLAGPAAAKLVAAVLVAGAAGVGAYEAGTAILGDSSASPPAAIAEGSARTGAPGRDVARTLGHAPSPDRASDDRSAAGGGTQSVRASSNGSGPNEPASAGAAGSPNAGSAAADPSGPSAPGGNAGGETGSGAGGGTGGGDAGGGTTPTPTPPAPEPTPPSGGGGSGAAPGTPPGHGGTAPGQGGTPPGQSGSGIPPGQIGNPGKSKNPK